MNRAHRRPRRAYAATTVATIAAALLALPCAAQDGFRGWEELRDARWRFDPDAIQVKGFLVAGSATVRDLLDEWETLRREGAALPAARKLQELIDDHGASALQVASDRYVGAAEWARWLVRTAPREIAVAYSRLAELNGRDACTRARADRDPFELRRVARRFANAVVGQEALLALAEFHRERGARQVAAYHARRVLDFALSPLPGEEARCADLAARAVALAALAGAADGLPAIEHAVALAGGGEKSLSEVIAAAVAPAAPAPDEWPTYGGDASRTRLAVPPVRALDLERSFDLPVENDRFADMHSPLREMIHSAIQPIRLGDRLYLNNTLSVRCYDLLTRALVWEHEGTQVLAKGPDEDGFLAVDDFTPRSDHDDPTFSKALVAGLSAGQGVVLASLQIPLIHNTKSYQGFRINDPCPIRGLVALDGESGALLWEQRPLVRNRLTERYERPEVARRGDPEGLLTRLDVPAPPAIVDDVVFALGHHFEGAVNTYLAALDVRTGEPWYLVPLASGQQELSMFNMPFQEFTLGCPAFADGTLYCSTNVGLVTAVDAAFGDLRWVKEYKSLPIEEPRNYFRNNPRTVVWFNRGAMASADLALFTPHDSRLVFSLDPATGKERWSRSFATQETLCPTAQLIGVARGRAYVAVAGKVLALAVEGGRIEWAWPDVGDERSPPRRRNADLRSTAAITEEALWLPLADELVVLSLDGRELAHQSWPRDEPKNLLVFPDLLVAAGQVNARVAFDPEQALAELRAQLARGETLELLTRVGSLERQSGQLEQAAATLGRALTLAGRSSPAEIARARAARCATLRELADQYLRSGDESGRERALIEAEELADEPQLRVELVQALLAGPARAASDPQALRWLERARSDFAGARVVVPELSPRPIALELWTGFELARRHEARGDFDAALVELQRLQSDVPSEPLAVGDSAALAQERLARLFERAPGSLRDRHDREAERAFADAAANGDVERLALLLRRFPGAASAPSYAAKEIELLRAARRPADALRLGAELLRGRANAELARVATIELARAARELGNLSIARGFTARLAEAAVPADLAALRARAEPTEPAAGHLELVKAIAVPANAALLGGADRPLRGEPLPAEFAGVLLLEQEFDDYAISCLALPSGESRWRETLRRPRANGHALVFVHVAGVLVVRRGTQLSAHDLVDGHELWTRELERDAPDVAAAAGMLLISVRTPPSHGGDEVEPVALELVEPRSGKPIASVGAAGSDTRPGQLVGSGGCAQLTTFGRRGQTVEVFDALTGRRRLEPKAAPIGITVPLLLPKLGVLVVPDTRTPPGEAAPRQGGVPRVIGWRLDDDTQAFAVDLLPLSYKLRATYPVAEGLALLGGGGTNAGVLVVDPVSGQPLGDMVPIPPDVADSYKRLLVQGEEGALDAQGHVDWRKGAPVTLQLLAGNGTARWRAELEVPKNTVQLILPDRMLRRGGAFLVAVQYHAGGKSRTDLVLLAASDGAVLARETLEGGKPAQRDDVVRNGEWVAARQDETMRVFGWR